MPPTRPTRKKHLPNVVLDSSVLVAAFLRRRGINHRLLRAAGRHYRLCLTERILQEVERTLLESQKLRRKYRYQDEEVESFIQGLRAVSHRIFRDEELKIRPVVERDPTDDVVIACARKARARYLVSKDHDLLALRKVGRVQILPTNEAVRLLRIPEEAEPEGSAQEM